MIETHRPQTSLPHGLRSARSPGPRPIFDRAAVVTEIAGLTAAVASTDGPQRLVALAARLMNARAVALWRIGVDGRRSCVAVAGDDEVVSLDRPNEPLESLVARGSEGPGVYTHRIDHTTLVAGCAIGSTEDRHMLVALLDVAPSAAEPFLVALQLLAGYVGTWNDGDRTSTTLPALSRAAAVQELIQKLAWADDVETGAHELAAGVADYLQATRVAIAQRGADARCELRVLSAAAEVDDSSAYRGWLLAAFDEVVVAGELLSYPADQARTPALAALAHHVGSAHVIAVPLPARFGEPWGVLVAWGSNSELASEANRAFLAALAAPAGATLAIQTRSQLPSSWRWARDVWRQRVWPRRRTWALGLAVGLAGLGVPLPYEVVSDCELQPVVRQYVAAPFDGIFDTSLVKPGDRVAAGAVLGRMDGRELRIQLAGVEADIARAAKSRDMNLAGGKTAAAQVDGLEVRRLEQQRRVLEHRAAQLEIRSPIAGLVIAGDLQRSAGVPLSMGQTLFEIAPVEALIAEVFVADDDALHVRSGQPVHVRLDAQSSQVIAGVVTHCEPRAKVHDDANVFVVEVAIDSTPGDLRPGMKGRARISTDWHPVGWNWFHKTAAQVWTWLRW